MTSHALLTCPLPLARALLPNSWLICSLLVLLRVQLSLVLSFTFTRHVLFEKTSALFSTLCLGRKEILETEYHAQLVHKPTTAQLLVLKHLRHGLVHIDCLFSF